MDKTLDYDTLWSYMITNLGKNVANIPNDEKEMKMIINNAVDSYNIESNDTENNLVCDDATEIIDLQTDDNKYYNIKKKILALFIKLNILQNDLEYFQEVYQYDLKEVKSKFYKNQVEARETTLAKVNSQIEQLFAYLNDGVLNE